MTHLPPEILIVDDLFGRSLPDGRNEERSSLCGQYLIEDISGDQVKTQTISEGKAIARAIFCRGQKPACAHVGDAVENDLAGTLEIIRDGWSHHDPHRSRWAMVLLDLCFYTGRVTAESDRLAPGMPEGRAGDDDPSSYFGLEILEAIHDEFADLPVVILSSKPRDEVSRAFAFRGAVGFLPREAPDGAERLKRFLDDYAIIPDDTDQIIGRSRAMLLALRSARKAAGGASSDRRNILIRGERGTGKELIARYIHRKSAKGGTTRPLVVVDSGVLTPSLYASELFGHKRGAFTGADRDHEGLVVKADGGDLFLDEIGNLPMDVQGGILRLLEYREVKPVGSERTMAVDVRFLSATNLDIEIRATTGAFRADLLDRLTEAGTVHIPPLRDRREDIGLLVERFVREAERAIRGALARTIEPEALQTLMEHDWPGNVRELRNCVLTAVREHPDVEHLTDRHLRILVQETTPKRKREILPSPQGSKRTLDELVQAMEACNLTDSRPSALAGRLPRVQKLFADILAKYLKAALEATRRVSPDSPEGRIMIHPAVKLMTGNPSLTASQAADVIKRLLQTSYSDQKLSDPVLRDAYEIALRLRPKQAKKREAAG